MQCTLASECDAPSTVCKAATCTGGTCGFEPATKKTPCSEIDGGFCDGAGHCVACLSAADCGNTTTTPCAGGVYTAPSTCEAGVCVPGEPTNCGAAKLTCKATGCEPCVADADCGPAPGPCKLMACKAGLCEKSPILQGSECLQPSSGTCNASGTCISAKYVFVTAATLPSNMGGTVGADTKCQNIAATAGLGGAWMSWTSSSASWPSIRFTKSTAAPYRQLDDTIVANDWAGLTSGALLHGIAIANNKMLLPQVDVWTGTSVDGTYAGASCGDWLAANGTTTAAVLGVSGATDGAWTTGKTDVCALMAHLYCFQQ